MSKLLEPHPVGSVNDSCHVLDCSQTTENINASSLDLPQDPASGRRYYATRSTGAS